jgi:ParB family transcriptional regulator, chromosome partitioning protein
MSGRKRVSDLVRGMGPTVPSEGEPRRRTNLKALLGTEDGTYQIVEARMLPLGRIVRNPDQPRQTWDEEKLRELADSIAARGVLQPIRVRRLDDGFQVVAGERRVRAAIMAGLTEIPSIVVEQEAAQAYIDGLIENIQREDLNPIDRAEALRQIRLNLGSVSWKEVGAAIGLSERSVFHLLNLQSLPEEIKRDVRSGDLTEKHGRALHRLREAPDLQRQAYEKIVSSQLSGDQALALVRELRNPAGLATPSAKRSPLVAAAEEMARLVEQIEQAVEDGPAPTERRTARLTLERAASRLEMLLSRLAD